MKRGICGVDDRIRKAQKELGTEREGARNRGFSKWRIEYAKQKKRKDQLIERYVTPVFVSEVMEELVDRLNHRRYGSDSVSAIFQHPFWEEDKTDRGLILSALEKRLRKTSKAARYFVASDNVEHRAVKGCKVGDNRADTIIQTDESDKVYLRVTMYI